MLELLKHMLPLFLCFLLLSSLNAGAGAGADADSGENPFTPKAYVIRYWNKEIANDLPKPLFLLTKASPLTAPQSALYSKLASQSSLSTTLPAFCSAAGLLCFPDLAPSLEKHDGNVKFSSYSDKNFTNYGTSRLGGGDEFKKYSDGENVVVDTFRRYSRGSTGHGDKFDNYAHDGNVVDQGFNTYGTNAVGGDGKFSNYGPNVNVPNLKFTSYSAEANGRKQTFTAYTDQTNAGDESFASYGKNGNGAENAFTSYGKDSNVIGSNFNAYGETANAASDTFTSYGFNGNVPENNFKNYGESGNGAIDRFTSYRDQSNVGDDSFQSYGKKSNSENVDFENYGKSFNEGSDKFSGYGNGAQGNKLGFKGYGVNNTFQNYGDKKSTSFASYTKSSQFKVGEMTVEFKGYNPSSQDKPMSMSMMSGKMVNKWIEPGKFFREAMLKEGTVMPMPDIRDKMPKRSFLPRVILSKLPFSSSKIEDLKQIFHASENSSMEGMLADGLSECERAPAKDETKRCVGSVEDMIDFATSVLGRNIVVRTTQNTAGSKKDILIGSVRGINGGKVTKSVSCHQTMFPYLLYYCHSVPKVRVYEADILDKKTKNKINHGVAICHVDTSSWSASHGAFIALGSKPGKIEVCHWIFENDMTWAVSD